MLLHFGPDVLEASAGPLLHASIIVKSRDRTQRISLVDQRETARLMRGGRTRHTALPTSSATSSAPDLSTFTPTGRPRACPSSETKPVKMSLGDPAGFPFLNGTKITL